MKILAILFLFLAYTVVKGMVLETASDTPAFTFPTLDVPSFSPIDVSGGCGGFVDCIEYVGAVIQNVAEGIIFIVLLLVALLVYIFQVIALIIAISFTGIDGAPTWINILLATPYAGALGFIIYKLVRSGKSED